MARMKCPHCDYEESTVDRTNWRVIKDSLRRNRTCLGCKKTYITYEINEDRFLSYEETILRLTSQLHRVRHMLHILAGDLKDVDDLYFVEAEAAKLLGMELNTLVRRRLRNTAPKHYVGDPNNNIDQVSYKYSDLIRYMVDKYGASEAKSKIRIYENKAYEREKEETEEGIPETESGG